MVVAAAPLRAVEPALVRGDPVAAARAAALRYLTPTDGIARRRRGKGFSYVDPHGRAVRDPATLSRIRALAIPPAWTDVVIATDPAAHLQAIGRDARGRKQYRYHPRWRAIRDAAKYARLIEFCHALPRLRRTIDRDLAARGLGKRKVTAAVVGLLETCQLRVGNDEYARANGSYGATTLRGRHARIERGAVELTYRGKAGVVRHVRVRDPRIAAIVRRCRALPGARLFEYVRDDGRPAPVTSADVNAYIHDVSGGPFTAKDYRTWAATMAAAALLCAADAPETARACKACVRRTIEAVAQQLGHTASVCRASYVDPRLVADFTSGRLGDAIGARVRRALRHTPDPDQLDPAALRAVEPIVTSYLARRTA